MIEDNNKLTLEKAREDSIIIWRYLCDNSTIDSKYDIFVEVIDLSVSEYKNGCPLCSIFHTDYGDEFFTQSCKGCPLYEKGEGCCRNWAFEKFEELIVSSSELAYTYYNRLPAYEKWTRARNDGERKAGAKAVLDIIEGWEII